MSFRSSTIFSISCVHFRESFSCLSLASEKFEIEYVVEPPNLMPHRSDCLPLDTKHSRKNTKLLSSVGHTPGENPKIHIFTIRITNEKIKLTSLLTISYIIVHITSEYDIYYLTAECNHIIRVMNNLS